MTADALSSAVAVVPPGSGPVTAPTPVVDIGDPRRAVSATGLLGAFNAAGVLDPADVHVATRLGRLGGEQSPEVLLAAALAVRAVRLGSVCLELAAVGHTVLGAGDELVDTSTLPWPEPGAWRAACAASPLVADGAAAAGGRPLRLVGGLLYLERYWHEEELVRRSLHERAALPPPEVDLAALRAGLERMFTAEGAQRQRLAAAVGALRRVTVLAGGPGTGKTTTVARLLALLAEQPGAGRIALAAPTGKAAARLQEAVTRELPEALRTRVPAASTLHRLLGWHPGAGTYKHNHAHRLPYDLVVVDETSMVSLSMMARLLDALRPQARLVLVGDPDQLASVEAGAVLGDLARAPGAAEPGLDRALTELGLPPGVVHGVVTLDHVWRFGGAIAAFARAVRDGDADAAVALLRRTSTTNEPDPTLSMVSPTDLHEVEADVVAAGTALTAAAEAGRDADALAALDEHRVLCAHRRGPYGVARWTAEIEKWLAAAVPGRNTGQGPWYPGRPLLVTANDYDIGLFNGDTGVVVATPDGPRVAFARGSEPELFVPSRLPDVVTVHAMTVHRGQGSQFRRVTVVLPPEESPLLTRELLYTAVTRAKEGVRIVGTEESVRAAIGRPVARASGLRGRLADSPG